MKIFANYNHNERRKIYACLYLEFWISKLPYWTALPNLANQSSSFSIGLLWTYVNISSLRLVHWVDW